MVDGAVALDDWRKFDEERRVDDFAFDESGSARSGPEFE